MALSGSTLLRKQTALQQLLEEINFQRAKEMRQMLKEDGGFVMLQGTTYWTDLFVRHFLFQAEAEQNIDSDDLLFFVRKKHVKGTSRHMPKYETEVDVYRKDSRKLPIGDPDVDWEETVYLNLIIHQFNYTLTLAICTRTSPKELQVLKRHSQRVYASPSRRKMDTKGDGEEMTYPHICFMVDNFDEVFCDIMVRDGEMVCVELVANDRDGTVQGVIFLGSIRYDALKKVYDARQSSISTKLAQRMTFGLFSSGIPQTRCEFVRMKGPQGKGHAEMAVTKPKGSGVETPTSEPGFCMTDMCDDWDEDPDNFFEYRHQRRLSDPSANLSNYTRSGWKTKAPKTNDQSSKAMSQNEGLDSLANEVSEIEAGDLKDEIDRSASSCKITTSKKTHRTRNDSDTKKATLCCNCFGPLKQMQRDDSCAGQMSDVYCRTCEDDTYDSPAILLNVPSACTDQRKQSYQRFLNVEIELEILNADTNEQNTHIDIGETEANCNPCDTINCDNDCDEEKATEYELGNDVAAWNDEKLENLTITSQINVNQMIRVRGKEELPASSTETINPIYSVNNANDEFNTDKEHTIPSNDGNLEESFNKRLFHIPKHMSKKTSCNEDHPLAMPSDDDAIEIENRTDIMPQGQNVASNRSDSIGMSSNIPKKMSIFERMHSTLPKMRKSNIPPNRMPHSIPTRTTPDGTTIYYFCNLSKRLIKELDDGAYNPLWTTRGFTQTFHFWKEHRRQQSVPLNAFLTYVTLPWWSIAKDLLDHRETPILTF